jgi:FMN-dependent NADH-azoreductase
MMTLDMDSRNDAEKVDSQDSEQVTSSLTEKLKTAYIEARSQLEIIEVELNRSKIVMIDEDGNMRTVPILSEH